MQAGPGIPAGIQLKRLKLANFYAKAASFSLATLIEQRNLSLIGSTEAVWWY
jgi:hypothetical protein